MADLDKGKQTLERREWHLMDFHFHDFWPDSRSQSMPYGVAKTLIESLQHFWLKQSEGRVWDNHSHWKVKGKSQKSESLREEL